MAEIFKIENDSNSEIYATVSVSSDAKSVNALHSLSTFNIGDYPFPLETLFS